MLATEPERAAVCQFQDSRPAVRCASSKAVTAQDDDWKVFSTIKVRRW